MSDFEAIAAVGTSLQMLLRDRMQLPQGYGNNFANRFSVTVGRPAPDRDAPAGNEQPRINLYAFRVERHPTLGNDHLVGESSPGDYGRPPLSLDVHYLLTAYGVTMENNVANDTLALKLLGSAMRVLHDVPELTDELEEINSQGAPRKILHPTLRGQQERIRVTLQPASMEEITKLWSALNATYRLAAVYKASVVQIESRIRRRHPRPVGEPPEAGPRVVVYPFRDVRIRELRVRRDGEDLSRARPTPVVRVGDILVIEGRNLRTPTTRVRFGEVVLPVDAGTLEDERVQVTIPDHALLLPGVQPVEILHDTPTDPSWTLRSSQAVALLVPRVDDVTYNAGTRVLRIEGSRLYHADGNSLTLVGAQMLTGAAYTLKTDTAIEMTLPNGFPAGTHLIRVRVRNAEAMEAEEISV